MSASAALTCHHSNGGHKGEKAEAAASALKPSKERHAHVFARAPVSVAQRSRFELAKAPFKGALRTKLTLPAVADGSPHVRPTEGEPRRTPRFPFSCGVYVTAPPPASPPQKSPGCQRQKLTTAKRKARTSPQESTGVCGPVNEASLSILPFYKPGDDVTQRK